MILGILRWAVLCFVLASVLYVALSYYSRSLHMGWLEREWEEQGRPGNRDDFVDAGMRTYRGSLRRKLIWGVYVIPGLLFLVTIYLQNFW
ncbi:hypothetical protein [Anianabacter salinae]|uniref:hypothetical protein n=1 Tax=Anianabacter salinae TaxID=2851023 RepID=UPI00225DDF3C|nr:hypothetical protein [Anianabacter salinae]MBV0913051.1 hypothetical protein [Anianabacter salinae]